MNFGFSLVLRITGTPASPAIERRRLAISSRLAAGGCADEKLKCHALFFCRYSSARDTRSIIRSYDSRASAPKEKMPCDSSTIPMQLPVDCFEVPAATRPVEHVLVLAEEVPLAQLD